MMHTRGMDGLRAVPFFSFLFEPR